MDSGDYAGLLARAAALSYAAEQLAECAREARTHQVFDDPGQFSAGVSRKAYIELEAIAASLERRALEIEKTLS